MTILSLPNYWIILLLGSYDPETERLLRQLKIRTSEHFMNIDEGVLVFLLDNLEAYVAEVIDGQGQRRIFNILGEFFDDGKRLGINILSEDAIQFADDVDSNASVTHEESIIKYLENNYEIVNFFKPPILTTLEQISKIATLTFVVRNTEMTRGGEYIELVYLLGLGSLIPTRTYFMKKEGFDLSTMAWEILDKHGVNFRSYTNDENLLKAVIRIFTTYLEKARVKK